jgi:hypothetical protein
MIKSLQINAAYWAQCLHIDWGLACCAVWLDCTEAGVVLHLVRDLIRTEALCHGSNTEQLPAHECMLIMM